MTSPHALGLRGRLILLLLTAFAILSGLVVWHLLHDHEHHINAASADLMGRARLMAARQESLMERADATLNGLMAVSELTPGSSAEECSRFLAVRLKREPAFSQIGLMQPNGDLTCSAVDPGRNVNGADRPWFQQAVSTRDLIISDAAVSRTLGKPVITLAKSARDPLGKVTGVLYLSLGLDWLEREIAGMNLPEGARLGVLDDKGVITLRYPDQGAWTGKSALHLPLVQTMLASGSEGIQADIGVDGARVLAAHTPFLQASGTRYFLVLAVPKHVIEAPAWREALLGLGAVLAVLVATMGWVVVAGNRLLLRPLMALSQTAARQRAGDLSARSGLPHGADEIGRLAAALDEAAAAIEDREGARRLALEAARESEETAGLIVENALDAFIAMNARGRIMRWNRQAEAIFGWSSQEVMGQLLSERIIPERYREAHQRGLERFIATGEGPILNKRMEINALRRNGEEFAVELSISPLKRAGSYVFSAFARDITKRKEAEAALRRAHEMARIAHVVSGQDGNFEAWSDTLPALIGIEPGSMPRSTREWLALIHPDDRARFRASAKEAETSKTRRVVEYRVRHGNGEWIHIRQKIESLEQQVGADIHVSRWFSTVQDVSVQKNAEKSIRKQLEHLGLLDEITRSAGERLDLKSIFQIVLERVEESLPVDFGCVCLHDPVVNGLLVTCVGSRSHALAHELGLEDQTSIDVDANGLGHCIEGRLVYEPDLRAVRNPFPERLAGGGLGSLVLAPLRSESQVFGVLMVARRAAQAFSSAECEFLRQLSAHVALAARHAQLYGSLQQAYDDLRQTQAAAMQEERLRALGQMASGVAHDINNALSPVSLYVESMLETERALSERGRGYLETIQRAVEDVSKTVARLREFYRQRERQLELAPVQVNDLAQQVVELTRARWKDMPEQQGVVIRAQTQLAPDLPHVMGVEGEIREALTNLVFNAVDAMAGGGTLTLRTRLVDADPRHPAVAVEVTDTGAGMDEETRRRCLEPFFTTKGERGTGLGLAMVFGMVQRHSAELEIDSAVGVGTTVRLLFGVPAAVGADPAEPGALPAVPSRLRLLLIDDDPILLKSLRDALEADGHLIVAANGGEEGVTEFRAALERGETFSAVMTDLGMPHVDGRRVASAVKEASPATPVILLTGWGQRMVADDDIPAHVDRVLAKPPKLRDLRAALAQLCPVATPEPDP